MSKDTEFFSDLMRQMREEFPELSPERAQRVEQRMRATWGGSEVYIAKRAAEGKARRLGAELASGTSLAQAIENAGLTRRTGYRILSRKWYVR